MYEFIIENKSTSELNIIFGRNIIKAMDKAKLNLADWTVVSADYID